MNAKNSEIRELKLVIKKKDVELDKHHDELRELRRHKDQDMQAFQKAAKDESNRLSNDVAQLLKRQIKMSAE